jgi:hypothetical protein
MRQKSPKSTEKPRGRRNDHNWPFPDNSSIRSFTGAVCAVTHISRRRAQAPKAEARDLSSNISAARSGAVRRMYGRARTPK